MIHHIVIYMSHHVAAVQLNSPVWKCHRRSVVYLDLHSNIHSSDWDTQQELHPPKPEVCREEGASLGAQRSLRDRQVVRQTGKQTQCAERRWLLKMLHYLWETDRYRWLHTHPVSPWAGMSIMAYGNVREITSCMMMEKLKTSPANEPPRTGFLKSSGAVHSRSERQTEIVSQTGRQAAEETETNLQLYDAVFMRNSF